MFLNEVLMSETLFVISFFYLN